MKLNAVKALMESLEFDQSDKLALVNLLNVELKLETQTPKQAEPQKQAEVETIGERQQFEMLFEDGTTGYYQRKLELPVGVIVERNGLRFAIYCRSHSCLDNSCRSDARRYASSLKHILGKEWKVIREAHCRAINNMFFFRALGKQLREVGWRPIVEGRTMEVLTDDGSLTSSKWEVWFVMDL